jgi:8-oxo-dGTP diphosphatase
MTPPRTRRIEATGGALWRPSDSGGIEIGLIHRPKYDDWSLPKGKIKSSEHPILGAVREVREETGFDVVVGRPLGEIVYEKDGSPKRVRYWAMRWVDGDFVPNDEVDEVAWLEPDEARKRLLPERDRSVLDELLRGPIATFPVVLARHGNAGERNSFEGPDRDRPLDAKGRRQAEGIGDLLDLYGVARVVSADVVRCLQTIEPYADRHGLAVDSDRAFSERGVAADADTSADRLVEIAATAVPAVVCSQGGAIPDLVDGLCELLGVETPPDLSVRKGALCVLHFDDEVEELELIDVELIEAVA